MHKLVQSKVTLAIFKLPESCKKQSEVKYLLLSDFKDSITSIQQQLILKRQIWFKYCDNYMMKRVR